jgi:hypothetical protein
MYVVVATDRARKAVLRCRSWYSFVFIGDGDGDGDGHDVVQGSGSAVGAVAHNHTPNDHQ